MSVRPTLVHRIRVRAPAEAVWRAITDPAFTEQYFFGLTVKSVWQRGARVVWELPDGTAHMAGEIERLEPPLLLRHSVRVLRDADTCADLPSRVTWEIREVEGGCELTVIHDEFDGETPTYRVVSGGWPMALAGLAELLETGSAARTQASWPDWLVRPPVRRTGDAE